MAIYLKNATYIDWETLTFKHTHIKVEEGLEGKIHFLDQLPFAQLHQATHVIDCSGQFVTRSFGCGHHHVYSALARGMPSPKKEITNFRENLKYIWWTLDKCLDIETIEMSALVTAIDCAKNGVTFVIDHHASPFAVEGSLETIAKAFDKVGVSHLLCYEITNRDGENIAEKGLHETEEYLKQQQGLVGLHASFTVNNNTLKQAVTLAQKFNSGIHIHVAEDNYDQEQCIKNYNKRVVERLKDAGVLDLDKSILVHCLHLSDSERDLIKHSNVTVAENMDSNLKNKVGYFNSNGLGDRIMLGTDGMYSDMLRSAKAAYFSGLGHEKINPEKIYQRLRFVHHYINNLGFKGDGENNLVVLNYPSPTEMLENNFLSHFIFGIESKYIQHVISAGKFIVKDKKLLTVEEHDILKESRKIAKSLWRKMSQ